LKTISPEQLGLAVDQWDRVNDLAKRLCSSNSIPALSFQVQKEGNATPVMSYGSRSLSESSPVDKETLFLVASLTKPIVAMALLLLVERGEVALNDPVAEFLPEFSDAQKKKITLRHLLTHTSGLPDMLPNNFDLRKAKAPLSAFVSGTCAFDDCAPVGRSATYQSMGFALLGPIISQAAKVDFRTFLRNEFFVPLGMVNTWLGLPDGLVDHDNVAEVRVPEVQRGGDDWNWNSRYWKTLGAPWGGVLSTVQDLSQFCWAMQNSMLATDGTQLLSDSTIELATTNRLDDFANIPETERHTRGWGLGWRLNWQDHRAVFSELLPEYAYGHWGATGTLFWIDPETSTAAVILSTAPIERNVSPLVRLSNAIVASFR